MLAHRWSLDQAGRGTPDYGPTERLTDSEPAPGAELLAREEYSCQPGTGVRTASSPPVPPGACPGEDERVRIMHALDQRRLVGIPGGEVAALPLCGGAAHPAGHIDCLAVTMLRWETDLLQDSATRVWP